MLALVALAGACGADDAPAASEPELRQSEAPQLSQQGGPDIVLILVDTLRADHLDFYGYERATSPFLSALAARSVVFANAFSTSSCTAPSTASLFTGMYPNQHGVWMGMMDQRRTKKETGRRLRLVSMPRAVTTLPEYLQQAGYATLGAASNINIGAGLGFDRGFDHFELRHKAEAEELVELLLEWRATVPEGQPAFIYLHINDVHKPYAGREDWLDAAVDDPGLTDLDRYDSEIGYADRWIEHLLGQLDGELDPVVMIVSDHGEEFDDHGRRGHGFSLYGEVNRVLMMLSVPGLAAARVEANVSLIDVMPTLLDAAGLEPLDGEHGRSLLALGRDSEQADGRTVFAHRIHGRDSGPMYERPSLWAVVRGKWKLIRNDREETVQLFDLAVDRTEQENLAEEQPELVRELSSELARFELETVRLEGDDVDIVVDDELFEHLKELGYAGDE